MADVFISYHDKTNGDRAEKIAATLESAGISCWYARRDVPAGGDFTHEVIKQIGDCTVFLLLLDEGAARSPHVETEVGNAFGRRKKIIPYQTDTKDIKGVSWVQYYLKQIQIVPFSDYDTLTKEIAKALGRPIKTVTPKPQPTKPSPKPQAAKPKPKTKTNTITFIDGFLIAVMLICVITSSMWGFIFGSQFDFVTGLWDAWGLCIIGYVVGGIIVSVVSKITYNHDNTRYAIALMTLIAAIWYIGLAILLAITLYMANGGILVAIFCGALVLCLPWIFY